MTASTTSTNTNDLAMLAVSTVKPAAVPAGFTLVTVSQRDSKNQKIDDANRLRAVCIPDHDYSELRAKYIPLFKDAILRVASDQLRSLWEETPAIQEVPAALFTLDSLILYAARETESQRLTKENIATFFNASELCKHVTEKKGADAAKKYLARMQNIAAPKPDYSEEQALTAIALLGKFPADVENTICEQMIAKLQKHIEAMKKSREEMFELDGLDD